MGILGTAEVVGSGQLAEDEKQAADVNARDTGLTPEAIDMPRR